MATLTERLEEGYNLKEYFQLHSAYSNTPRENKEDKDAARIKRNKYRENLYTQEAEDEERLEKYKELITSNQVLEKKLKKAELEIKELKETTDSLNGENDELNDKLNAEKDISAKLKLEKLKLNGQIASTKFKDDEAKEAIRKLNDQITEINKSGTVHRDVG